MLISARKEIAHDNVGDAVDGDVLGCLVLGCVVLSWAGCWVGFVWFGYELGLFGLGCVWAGDVPILAFCGLLLFLFAANALYS